MRIYSNVRDMVRETEREIFEMGIHVHPQTMQDKHVGDDPDYDTLELQEYAFQVTGGLREGDAELMVNYVLTGSFEAGPHEKFKGIMDYIDMEYQDRIALKASNPGNSWIHRKDVWEQFLHNGKFAYTYSERLQPQWTKFLAELRDHPETRQAILNLHTNICPIRFDDMRDEDPEATSVVDTSMDHQNMGGSGRIPCSLYYQAIKRQGKLHWIYAMRSCDFLVHFAVDVILAMKIQEGVAKNLGIEVGPFTYFTGSLHAYHKDLKTRGIF